MVSSGDESDTRPRRKRFKAAVKQVAGDKDGGDARTTRNMSGGQNDGGQRGNTACFHTQRCIPAVASTASQGLGGKRGADAVYGVTAFDAERGSRRMRNAKCDGGTAHEQLMTEMRSGQEAMNDEPVATVRRKNRQQVSNEGFAAKVRGTDGLGSRDGDDVTVASARTTRTTTSSTKIGVDEMVDEMHASVAVRDEERATRYVDTVRPAMAAVRIVRGERERELRDDAVGSGSRNRRDGGARSGDGDQQHTGEGGNPSKTGEGGDPSKTGEGAAEPTRT
ncbi:hypothetical protein ON010_g3448 [Phytophthora cinnamomi]|nr:hypothetical protein ON010_g3448 [Phytophthora cinnamomi]